MSQFLAPIHTWLFNKIVILEDIEKGIVAGLDSKDLKDAYGDIQEKFGDFMPDQPLENLIDQSNIHGWLQDRITKAESRQAALVHLLMAHSSDAVEGVANIYHSAGNRIGKKFDANLNSAAEIFNALNNALLEGMPCDRVNFPIDQSDERMVWKTSQCVHKNNWESNGVDVAYYYTFREAFTKGFVETIGNGFTYTYINAADQIHTIEKQ